MSDDLIDASARSLAGTLNVGALGYGCWRLVAMPAAEAQARIEAALDAGMNLIDTADVYGLDWGGQAFGEAEALLGAVLKQAPALRERMVLASKGGIVPGVPYDSSDLVATCEASLSRLGVEHIDLYQIHRPDMLTHPARTAEALVRLMEDGKIGAVGVSNHTTAQVEALQAHLPFSIASNQPEYSAVQLAPLFDGTFDQCMARGLTPIVWSPLGGGRLATGEGVQPALMQVVADLAEREGVTVDLIALAFALAHPSRPVALVGSIQIDRIQHAAQALEVTLNRADVYAIIQASMGEALP